MKVSTSDSSSISTDSKDASSTKDEGNKDSDERDSSGDLELKEELHCSSQKVMLITKCPHT